MYIFIHTHSARTCDFAMVINGDAIKITLVIEFRKTASNENKQKRA